MTEDSASAEDPAPGWERDAAESELAAVFERVTDAFFALDRDWRFTHVNDRASEVFGRPVEAMLGAHIWTTFDELVGTTFQTEYERAMAEQTSVSFEAYFEPQDAWYAVDAYPAESGLSVYFRDVTERKEREADLARSRRRYRTLVEHFPNGVVTLFDADLRYLVSGGEGFTEYPFDVTELEGERLEDVVPAELAEQIRPHYEAALDGEKRTFEVPFAGRTLQFYSIPIRDEAGRVVAGMGMSQDVTAHRRQERELRRQREQLAAVNHLNAIGREIVRTLLRQSTREEIERLVCERLAESDSYAFAWVGAVEKGSNAVYCRTEAGVTRFLDGVTIRVDEGEGTRSPTGRAFRTGEVQVCRVAECDPDYERWRSRAETYGYSASVAVPIGYEGTVYGVLNVYTERAEAFDTEERAVLAGLGDVMGHAINAIERQRLLLSDEVTEVEFRIRSLVDFFGFEGEASGTVTVDETIPTGEDEFLAYGSADEAAREWLATLVDLIPYWRDLDYVGRVGGDHRFEIHLEDPPVLSLLGSHGGRIKTARISDGDYHMTVQLPPDASVRAVVDGVEGIYPDAEMLVQRRTTIDGVDTGHRGIDLGAILTDRQLAVLQAAYYAGFFEWPRESTGEEVAAALGISPPTFHQHLRAAEQRILRTLLVAEHDQQA